MVTLPQEIGKQARVKLKVIDGFVERIDVEALPWKVRTRARRAVTADPQAHLTQAEWNALQIAGDSPAWC